MIKKIISCSIKIISYSILILPLPFCNLQKDIYVQLPEHEKQIVVECYLEPGKPYRLLLTESTAFEASPLPNVIVPAIVTITYKGKMDTLKPIPTIDTAYHKFYNYVSDQIVQYDTIHDYFLNIKLLTTLKQIKAQTRFMPFIPIHSIRFVVRNDSSASLRLVVLDPPYKKNYYRLIVNGDTLQKPERFKQTFSDEFFDNGRITFISNFRFFVGEPLVVTLYHLTPEHYYFLKSIQDATSASSNPFTVPSQIKSNIVGGTGIFTTLSYDRKYVIVNKND